MGTQRSGGYTIDINEVRIDSEGAQIVVTERSPGSGFVTASLT